VKSHGKSDLAFLWRGSRSMFVLEGSQTSFARPPEMTRMKVKVLVWLEAVAGDGGCGRYDYFKSCLLVMWHRISVHCTKYTVSYQLRLSYEERSYCLIILVLSQNQNDWFMI
jgi:hypothetical protein